MFLTPSARRRARFLAVSFLLVLGTGLLLSTAWQVYRRSTFAHTVLSYRFEYGEEPVTLPGSGQYHDGVPLEEMDFQRWAMSRTTICAGLSATRSKATRFWTTSPTTAGKTAGWCVH